MDPFNIVEACAEQEFKSADNTAIALRVSNSAPVTKFLWPEVEKTNIWEGDAATSSEVLYNSSGTYLPNFKLKNGTLEDVSGFVKIQAEHTNGCKSPLIPLNITVRPLPQLNSTHLNERSVCPNTWVAIEPFTTNLGISGYYQEPVVYWTLNDDAAIAPDHFDPTDIGGPVSSQGNIGGFRTVSVNNTGNNITGIFTITPTTEYTSGTPVCTGTPQNITVKVFPTPAAPVFVDVSFNDPDNLVFCNNESVPEIEFTSSTTGATYSWEYTNDEVGLNATNQKGDGSIESFLSNNGTTTLNTANFRVTSYSPTTPACPSANFLTFAIKVQPTAPVGNFAPVNFENLNLCNESIYSGVDDTAPINYLGHFRFSTAFSNDNGSITGDASNFSWEITNNYDADNFRPNPLATPTLPQSANGFLPTFTPYITGSESKNLMMRVTAWWQGCEGGFRDFPLSLNPLPSITNIVDQYECSGQDPFNQITLQSNITSTFEWEVEQGSPTIDRLGLANGATIQNGIVSGTGNSITFVAPGINNTGTPTYTGTVSVRAKSSAGCLSNVNLVPMATVTVLQTPVMVTPPSFEVCADAPYDWDHDFKTTNVSDPTHISRYNWNITPATDASVWNLGSSGVVTWSQGPAPGFDDQFRLPTFTPQNNVGSDRTARVFVTATQTYLTTSKTCMSQTPVFFDITSIRTANVNPISDFHVCPLTEYTSKEIPIFTHSLGADPYTVIRWSTTDAHEILSFLDPYTGDTSGERSIPDFETLENEATLGNPDGDFEKRTFKLTARRTYDTFNNYYCDGATIDFNVILNPTPLPPKIYQDDFQIYCDGDIVPQIEIFSESSSNVGFSWFKEINGDDIGMLNDGGETAIIPSFTARNKTMEGLYTSKAQFSIITRSTIGARCTSVANSPATFDIWVKPIPRLLDFDPIEICGYESYPDDHFKLNPIIENEYSKEDELPDNPEFTYRWYIENGHFAQSGLPAPVYTPDIVWRTDNIGDYKPDGGDGTYPDPDSTDPNKQTHPLWGTASHPMLIKLIPEYGGCLNGREVTVPITLKPRPITSLVQIGGDCLTEAGSTGSGESWKVFMANEGKLTAVTSTFAWELLDINDGVITDPYPLFLDPKNSAYFSTVVFDFLKSWSGKIKVLETNLEECYGIEYPLAINLLPPPIIRPGVDIEICFGEVIQLHVEQSEQSEYFGGSPDEITRLANPNEFDPDKYRIEYDWRPASAIADNPDNPGSGFITNTLNPWLSPLTTMDMRIIATVINKETNIPYNCESDVQTIKVTVLNSPAPLAAPPDRFCEENPEMIMHAIGRDDDLEKIIYWERHVQESDGTITFEPIAESEKYISINMKDPEHVNALPSPLWKGDEIETTIYYNVYQSAILGNTRRQCESLRTETFMTVLRTPEKPEFDLFAYCEDFTRKYVVEVNVPPTERNAVSITWYTPDGTMYASAPPGDSRTIMQEGFSPPDPDPNAPFTHIPFYWSVKTQSSRDCYSDAREIPLIIYQNPVLDYILSDENGPGTTGGCAPFELFATNTSLDDEVDYKWYFGPLDVQDAPIGERVSPKEPYPNMSNRSQIINVELSGVKVHKNLESVVSCSSIKEDWLTIHPYVKADFELLSDAEGCDQMSVNFANISYGGYNFRWYWDRKDTGAPDFVTGAPQLPSVNPNDPLYGVFGPNQIKIFDNKGSDAKEYHVWLQVDNGLCHSNKDAIITVYPAPKSLFEHNLAANYNSVCPPDPVIFTNLSGDGVANDLGTGYTWNFGDFTETTVYDLNSVEKIYENWVSSTPLARTVTLTATNQYPLQNDILSCSSSYPLRIMVNPQVEARFTGPDWGCSPFTADFRSQSLGSLTRFDWDFGDGNHGTGTNPQNKYENSLNQIGPEDYTVTLTVGNSWCNHSIPKIFTLRPQPVATFTVDETSGCQPMTVTFTNTSKNSTPMTYEFDYSDGRRDVFPLTNVHDAKITHEFINLSGGDLSRNPVLTATNQWECVSEPHSVQITIFPYLKALFEVENAVGCDPLTVTFLNGSQGYYDYTYTYGDDKGGFDDGDRDDPYNTTYTYNNPTMYEDRTYEVVLSVRAGVCTDEMRRTVTVYAKPRANFRPGLPYPDPITFPATNIVVDNLIQYPDKERLTYEWSWKQQGSSSNYEYYFSRDIDPAPFRITEDWGEFEIKQLVTSPTGRCFDSKTVVISIEPPPPLADFDDVVEGCEPYDVEFFNTSKYARFYKWEFGDGDFTSERDPIHRYIEAGTYTVRLTAIGDHPMPNSAYKTVVVHPRPRAGFAVSPDFLWTGQTLNITNTTVNNTANGDEFPVWYRWDWGDGSPKDTVKNPMHNYRKSGTFTIALTVGTYTDPQCISTITKHDVVEIGKYEDIVLPNIFRPYSSGEQSDDIPNGGYKNYLFYPPVLGEVEKYDLKIFTRQGQMIYHSTDETKGWNGYYRGRLCDEGVYMYRIEGVFINRQPFLKVGDVLLLR